MSQRKSGYARIERDAYETPPWVTEALIPHLNLPITGDAVWEPACGSGKMVKILWRYFRVVATDIASGQDFLKTIKPPSDVGVIVTNPPYNLAHEFIEHALRFDAVHTIAFLLRADFDSAHSRRYLFGNCERFSKKVVLTKRIQWFEDSKASPSFNHAWYLWSARRSGKPTIAYGP